MGEARQKQSIKKMAKNPTHGCKVCDHKFITSLVTLAFPKIHLRAGLEPCGPGEDQGNFRDKTVATNRNRGSILNQTLLSPWKDLG